MRFKYPYHCIECGHSFQSTGSPIDCHKCHTKGSVIDLRVWEKGHLQAANEFIARAKKAGICIAGKVLTA